MLWMMPNVFSSLALPRITLASCPVPSRKLRSFFRFQSRVCATRHRLSGPFRKTCDSVVCPFLVANAEAMFLPVFSVPNGSLAKLRFFYEAKLSFLMLLSTFK